jgi:hypothetical protein
MNHIYYLKHKEKIKEYHRKYHQKNRSKIIKYSKEYKKFNKEKTNQYATNKRQIDINYKILGNLRARINKALKRNRKSTHTVKLLGCSIRHLKKYLKSKFRRGMSWNNHGTGWNGKGMKEWHIDHIKPCASFDLSKPSEQRKCFHYTNLQPLWAEENLAKRQRDRDIYEK